jgi:hypothetical protein
MENNNIHEVCYEALSPFSSKHQYSGNSRGSRHGLVRESAIYRANGGDGIYIYNRSFWMDVIFLQKIEFEFTNFTRISRMQMG